VIKVINTHFHFDHTQGNESYAATNSKVEIIATEQTKVNLTTPGSGVGGVSFVETQIKAMPAEIDKLKADIQKESDPAKKKNLESSLQQAESYLQELKSMKVTLPTRTVTTTTTLKENGREIQLHVLGRAHTNGDLFIYLPKEKVVATGDALIDWMPFMNDGEARLHIDRPRSRRGTAQEPCRVFPRILRRSHRRGEEGLGRQGDPGGDADEDR